MSRYIDADDLKAVIKANDWSNPVVPDVVGVIIDRTPTADVVEVRHSKIKWVNRPISAQYATVTDEYGEKHYGKVCDRIENNPVGYCGECGKRLDDTFMNYCPNCGAKMNGERREKTNFEKIKEMSVEELASFICACSDCGNGRCYGNGLCTPGDGAYNGLIKWLKSEVAE